MNACKCGHQPATHVGNVGVCTDIKCACDRYEPRKRAAGDEAHALAGKIAAKWGDWMWVASEIQELVDQRTSWEREAAKLLAQRDYAERRANEVEARHGQLLEQLRAVMTRFDSGAAR